MVNGDNWNQPHHANGILCWLVKKKIEVLTLWYIPEVLNNVNIYNKEKK